MFKKHMTPLTKGGSLVKHKGKGSAFHAKTGDVDPFQQTSLGGTPVARSLNDYAKTTPMANPQPDTDQDGM